MVCAVIPFGIHQAPVRNNQESSPAKRISQIIDPMAKFAITTLVVFVCAAGWLVWAWAQGNQTYSWKPVPATVTNLDAEKPYNKEIATTYLTTVTYSFDGQQYEAVIRDYMLGPEVTIYVNPEDPQQVVPVQGPTVFSLLIPCSLTIASGLFALVLGLIVLSPKDD